MHGAMQVAERGALRNRGGFSIHHCTDGLPGG
jgi:hypothetical protein